MPTPLTPDEEFDAHFRQGLEHYPEQPDNPAAWQRMDLLLDAQLRQHALRRRVWRLLGAEVALVLLSTWLVVHWAATGLPPSRPQAAAATKATATKQPALPLAGATSTRSRTQPAATPPPTAGLNNSAEKVATDLSAAPAAPGEAAATAAMAAATPARPSRAGAAVPITSSAAVVLATMGRRRPAAGPRPTDQTAGWLAATRRRTPAPAAQPGSAEQPGTASAARPGQPGRGAAATAPAIAATARRTARAALTSRRFAGRVGVGGTDEQENASARQGARAAHRRQLFARPGAVPAASTSLAAVVPRLTEPAGPAGPLDSLAARYPGGGPWPLPDSLAARPRPADSLSQPKPLPAWATYRLRVGVVASPEFNSVRTNRPTALGGDVGVQLDYQLARRWHLNVSYLQTMKRYEALGTDYHLPAGYTTPHNWTISEVDAVCRIVDIPINLRYDVWHRPGHQFFISAGLSSLLMRREQYTYYYKPANGKTYAPSEWTLADRSNHFLKILNLSAGYERAVSARWTVQAEPYLKLPLAGVGFGSVRLLSAGMFFSFRYGLLPTRPATPAVH